MSFGVPHQTWLFNYKRLKFFYILKNDIIYFFKFFTHTAAGMIIVSYSFSFYYYSQPCKFIVNIITDMHIFQLLQKY